MADKVEDWFEAVPTVLKKANSCFVESWNRCDKSAWQLYAKFLKAGDLEKNALTIESDEQENESESRLSVYTVESIPPRFQNAP